jgi:hypothetical protein
MDRRKFLGVSTLSVTGLFVGQAPPREETVEQKLGRPPVADIGLKFHGDSIHFPGFFTVFVDGKPYGRMRAGDRYEATGMVHVVAYMNFETTPAFDRWLTPGESLEIG